MADPFQSLITKDRSYAQARPWQSEAGAWVFNVGLVLFLAGLVFFGGLFLYSHTLNSSRGAWQKEVARQEADLRPDLLQQLIDLSNELSATKSLLANHVFATNIFTFLQEVTHTKVQYNNFTFSAEGLRIELSSVAASYRTVAEQVRILEAHPQVQKVEFGGLAKSELGLVTFRVSVVVKPSLLSLRPQVRAEPQAPSQPSAPPPSQPEQ